MRKRTMPPGRRRAPPAVWRTANGRAVRRVSARGFWPQTRYTRNAVTMTSGSSPGMCSPSPANARSWNACGPTRYRARNGGGLGRYAGDGRVTDTPVSQGETQAAATGAALVWRVQQDLRLPVLAPCADGSYRSLLSPTRTAWTCASLRTPWPPGGARCAAPSSISPADHLAGSHQGTGRRVGGPVSQARGDRADLRCIPDARTRAPGGAPQQNARGRAAGSHGYLLTHYALRKLRYAAAGSPRRIRTASRSPTRCLWSAARSPSPPLFPPNSGARRRPRRGPAAAAPSPGQPPGGQTEDVQWAPQTTAPAPGRARSRHR